MGLRGEAADGEMGTFGFTVHGQIEATSAAEAEDSGSPLVNALLALDFVTEAEVWITLTPEDSRG